MKEEKNDIYEVEEITKKEISVTTNLDNNFISNFKSMYYTLNATPDTQTQVFTDDRLISYHDITRLKDMVGDKLATHNVVTSKVSIHISFKDGHFQNFQSWEEFERTRWNHVTKETKSCVMKWDSYIQIPNYEVPQRHTLTVRMNSDLRPDEVIKLVFDKNTDVELESSLANVVCKVDFVNSVISDELLFVVSNWYKGLEKIYTRAKVPIIIKKHKSITAKLLHHIFPLLSLFIIYGITKYLLSSYPTFDITSNQSIQYLSLWLLASVGFSYTFYIIGFFIASSYYSKAEDFIENDNFKLTLADSNKQKEIEAKNRRLSRKIIFQLSCSLVFAILSVSFQWIIKLF